MARFSAKDEAQWDALMREVDRVARQVLGPAFETAMEYIRQQTSYAALARMLAEQGPVAVEQHILNLWSRTAPSYVVAANRAFQHLAGVAMSTTVGAALPAGQVLLAATFDQFNPQAAVAAQQYGAKNIRQVTDQLRGLVREVTTQGIQLGEGPAATARVLRGSLGLTARQRQAVVNYRRYLEEGDPVVLERALRDRRHDPLLRRMLEGKVTLSKDQIDAQVAAYERRYLKYRAETIARTEALNALHLGNQAAWQQAVDRGMVRSVLGFWHVARDERTCPVCAPVPRMNPNGVPFGGQFATPTGLVSGPTLHPDCRCVVFYRPG